LSFLSGGLKEGEAIEKTLEMLGKNVTKEDRSLNMIIELTPEQNAKVTEYYNRYFDQAISTEPSDHNSAEKAAKLLVKLGGVEVSQVVWISSPQERWNVVVGEPGSFKGFLKKPFASQIEYYFEKSLQSSLKRPLPGVLREDIRDWLWAHLWNFDKDLNESFYSSLWDTAFVAFYTFCFSELGVRSEKMAEKALYLMNDLLISCFAFWVIPGTIILCERPKSFEVRDGTCVGIKW
jgi:hypothetical protein